MERAEQAAELVRTHLDADVAVTRWWQSQRLVKPTTATEGNIQTTGAVGAALPLVDSSQWQKGCSKMDSLPEACSMVALET